MFFAWSLKQKVRRSATEQNLEHKAIQESGSKLMIFQLSEESAKLYFQNIPCIHGN